MDEVRVLPSAAAWAEFWDVAADAGVRRWRREYMAEGVVDGAGWGLRIVADGVVIDSHGSNAWPDRTGREHLAMIPRAPDPPPWRMNSLLGGRDVRLRGRNRGEPMR